MLTQQDLEIFCNQHDYDLRKSGTLMSYMRLIITMK